MWHIRIVQFMMTSSNGNIFRVTGPLCGDFTGPGEFLAQRPVTRSFDVFFLLRLNKRLSKQPRGWWFETAPWSLWRQCNVLLFYRVCFAAHYWLWNIPTTIISELYIYIHLNSLGPSDAIWWQRSGSTLAQVMGGCLTAPSHYLNQCWLIVSKVEWHSSKGKFTGDASAINYWNYLEN